jgi:ankyrin repeat protein
MTDLTPEQLDMFDSIMELDDDKQVASVKEFLKKNNFNANSTTPMQNATLLEYAKEMNGGNTAMINAIALTQPTKTIEKATSALEQPIDKLVTIFGPKKDKFDMVFIIGQDSLENRLVIERAKKSGLSICFVGDGGLGEESFLTKKLLQETLSGRMDNNTSLHISGHGGTKKVTSHTEKDKAVYTDHTIQIYKENNESKILQADVKAIYESDPSNIGSGMETHWWACHAGAAHTSVDGLMHGGQKYTTLSFMNAQEMIDAIGKKEEDIKAVNNKETRYLNVMRSIINSPQTGNYKEDGKLFSYSAPKTEADFKDIKSFQERTLNNFLKFRRDELGHKDIGTDDDIAQKVKSFMQAEIKETTKGAGTIEIGTIDRYQNNGLIMETMRGSDRSENTVPYMKRYIDNGADVNARLVGDDRTLLGYAIYGNSNAKAIEFLVTKVSIDGDVVYKALSEAAKNNEPEKVKPLLQSPRISSEQIKGLFLKGENSFEMTAVLLNHYAQKAGKDEVVKLFDLAVAEKKSPLICACANHPLMAGERSAEIKQQFENTLKSHNVRMAFDLVNHPAIDTNTVNGMLKNAVEKGPDFILSVCLERKDVDVNQVDKSGRSLLNIASANSKTNAIIELAGNTNTDVNKDAAGRTPLGIVLTPDSAGSINLKAVEALLKHPNIDINKKSDIDGYQTTPIGVACWYGNSAGSIDAAKMLVVRGAEIDGDTKTTLMGQNMNQEIKGFIEKYQKLENIAKGNNTTPLNEACKSDPEFAKELIQAGADVNKTDSKGKTPFDFASAENKDLIGALTKAGAVKTTIKAEPEQTWVQKINRDSFTRKDRSID